MINVNRLALTKHAESDHRFRKQEIDLLLGDGFGNTIAETYHKGSYHVLTDKGLIFIVNEQKTTIITYYIANIKKARMIYGKKKMPDYLERMIQKNVTKYDLLFQRSIKRSI